MNEPFTHHTFEPIFIDGGRRIVAPESEWVDLERRCRAFTWLHRRDGRQRSVEIGGDLFEPWEGVIRDIADTDLCVCHGCGCWKYFTSAYCEDDSCKEDRLPRRLAFADVRRRVFRLIDDCPHITFMVNTTRLEEAARLIPPYEYHACETGDCPHDTTRECDSLAERQYRDNLILGTTVSTQRDVDERLPLLLRLPAAVLWVRCVPGEALEFGQQLVDQEDNGITTTAGGCVGWTPGIDWLTIAGSLDSPTNLDHVRGIIAQGRAAGVPVWVEIDNVPEDV